MTSTDDTVTGRTVTLCDILNKLNEITTKQDAIVEKLDTSNEFLKQISESLSKW